MIHHDLKIMIIIFKRYFGYMNTEINALNILACLSLESEAIKSHSKQKKSK